MSFSEWQECNLGQVCKITMGQSPKSEFYNTEGNGVVFLQGNRTFGDKYPIYDTFTSIVTKLANVGDVIMSVRAPVGDVNIATLETCLGRGICGLRMYNNNQEFLYYLMKYNSVNLIKKESGTVFGSINKGDINSLKVKIPTLDSEQKAIADILSSLDEKIELNNQMNKTLEEMAQSIFKRWFVDFNFPDGDGEPYKDSGGKMVESELGMIPEGWEVKALDNIADLIMGVSPSSSSYNEENIGLPLINGASDFKGKLIQVTKYTTEPKKTCKSGDMVFGVRATIGNTVFADKEYAIGRGVAAVVPIDNIDRELLYFKLENSMEKLINNASGSVFLNLKKSDISNVKFAYNKETAIKLHSVLYPILDSIISNDNESSELKQTRDTLLPKLMSGEIRVNDLKN